MSKGFELEVLKGASNSLEYVDEILCEWSFVELYSGQPLADEVISFLQQQRFRLEGVSGRPTPCFAAREG
jgi:hypothetical protein